MMSCKEVAQLLASDDWRKASLLRRLQIRLHLWMCGDCRRYGAQLAAMGQAAAEIFSEPRGDQDAIERLKASLLDDDAS